MNVSRRLPDNTVNPKEINQQVISMTSAGVRTSFAYQKLIDDFVNAIISPKNSFVFGCDYRVPVLHGLLEKSYIDKLKMSPSYNETSFAREYKNYVFIKLLRIAGSSLESKKLQHKYEIGLSVIA